MGGRGDSVELVAAAAAAQNQLDRSALVGIGAADIDPVSYMPTTILGKSLYFWINLVVLAMFAYECLLKIIIQGFVFNSGPTQPYMRAGLNVLDFVIISA